jgi:hypothetical protein
MASPESVYLGVGLCGGTIHIASSLGQRSSISADGVGEAEDWVELATYGVPLPEARTLLACVAVPSGHAPERRRAIVKAARQSGWDGVVLVKSLAAARRALRERSPEGLAMIVVDPQVTSVGIHTGQGTAPVEDDCVRPIPGREAREAAVSLRVLLKTRPRDEQRQLLRKVVVTGDAAEIARVGKRSFERELASLGVREVEFQLDPYLIAQGAKLLAEETEPSVWRRFRKRGS